MVTMDLREWQKRKRDLVQKHDYGKCGSYTVEYNDKQGFFLQKTAYDALESVFLARIVNVVDNFLKKPWSETRVLDLACMDGLSSIEFAMQGAKEVIGIEGRANPVECANFAKESLGLKNLTFYHDDVRNVTKEKYGTFDVVLCLGILYHLDIPDMFHFAKNISRIASDLAIIDTHFVFISKHEAEFEEKKYHGNYAFEHYPTSSMEDRMRYGFETSLDNEKSFWLTKTSLCNLLINVGFTSLYQCIYPRGGGRQTYDDRITLIAQKNALRSLKAVTDVGAQKLENLPEKPHYRLVASTHHPFELLK